MKIHQITNKSIDQFVNDLAEGTMGGLNRWPGGYDVSYEKVLDEPGINHSNEIDESISLDTTIKNITSISDSISQVYEEMKEMARKWHYNRGDLKGFGRNVASIGFRWYNNFYFNRLQKELYDLTKFAPKYSADLNQFLKNASETGKSHAGFKYISERLPEILFDLGNKGNFKELVRFARFWEGCRNKYEEYIAYLDLDKDDTQSTSKKDNIVGRQNTQVEEIVNSVLSRISPKISGNIRNAIAKSPNKLAALQQELRKYNIEL